MLLRGLDPRHRSSLLLQGFLNYKCVREVKEQLGLKGICPKTVVIINTDP